MYLDYGLSLMSSCFEDGGYYFGIEVYFSCGGFILRYSLISLDLLA